MEVFPTYKQTYSPFFSDSPKPIVEDKSKQYSTTGIILGTLGITGFIGVAIMAILNVVRNVKKPDQNERRQSIENSSQISRQSSSQIDRQSSSRISRQSSMAESEQTRRPSVSTAEPDISRTSSISRVSRTVSESDSDSSGSKEVIDMGISSALSPLPRRNNNDENNDFSLLKVSKEEVNEVMNILRQRNKAVSIYK